ncbi:hypothetical protein TSUD_09500, partial [Trifolium subterraneum]
LGCGDCCLVTVGSNNGVDRKMDKNKNRTDLLAAGKKKLQQYRQKKENKGGSSRGKSSKKSSKNQLPESDADTASVTSTGSSQVTDGNVETNSDPNVVITESLESQSLASSAVADNVDPSVDSLSVAMTYDTGDITELDSNANLALEGHGVHENVSELSSQDQGGSSQNVGSDVAKDVSPKTSNSGGTTHDNASEPVAVLSRHASITTTVDESVTVEKESEKREESLPLSEDIPNTFVAQTREDQDIGWEGWEN